MFADALIIMEKEFRNLIKNRRTLIMTFGLPLILFPTIFFGMSKVNQSDSHSRESSVYYVEFRNFNDPRFREILKKHLNYIASDQGVSDVSLIIERKVNRVEIFYDSSARSMDYAASQAADALGEYNGMLGNAVLARAGLKRSDLDIISVEKVDQATAEAKEGQVLAVFIPYAMILFLLIGAMSLVLDVTAGEKERGTIAVLLVNQVSRTSIALGKTFYVIICSVLNSFSSVAGMALGFLLIAGDGGRESVSLTVFTISMILRLLLILISVSAVISSLMVYLGSLARSLKEGASYVMPVYILGIFAVVITMNMTAAGGIYYYLLPVVNGVFIMKSLLTGAVSAMPYLLCLFVNLGFTAAAVLATSRLYNSERVLKTL